MKRGKIEVFIFDIGGVLELNKLNFLKKGVHFEAAKKFKVSLDQYFDAIDSVYVKSMDGKVSKKQVLKVISKNLNLSERKIEKVYYKLYKRYFKENKQLFKQAFKLKKQGFKIAILSDQWHLSKEALLPKKYLKKFNEVVVSCDVGIRKTDVKIYKLILKKLNTKPEKTMFVDNQKWNIDIAKKLGMKVVLFKNNKQLFKQLEKING
jgi:epoxide hydrolase-like predicted phosphatase